MWEKLRWRIGMGKLICKNFTCRNTRWKMPLIKSLIQKSFFNHVVKKFFVCIITLHKEVILDFKKLKIYESELQPYDHIPLLEVSEINERKEICASWYTLICLLCLHVWTNSYFCVCDIGENAWNWVVTWSTCSCSLYMGFSFN